MTTNQRHIELLIHMLGAGSHIRRGQRGYRNNFCAEIGGDHHKDMLEMQSAGLVSEGYKINGGRDQYFHATLAGCQMAGLSKAAIKRAMEK